jgi:hypothetical protein
VGRAGTRRERVGHRVGQRAGYRGQGGAEKGEKGVGGHGIYRPVPPGLHGPPWRTCRGLFQAALRKGLCPGQVAVGQRAYIRLLHLLPELEQGLRANSRKFRGVDNVGKLSDEYSKNNHKYNLKFPDKL